MIPHRKPRLPGPRHPKYSIPVNPPQADLSETRFRPRGPLSEPHVAGKLRRAAGTPALAGLAALRHHSVDAEKPDAGEDGTVTRSAALHGLLALVPLVLFVGYVPAANSMDLSAPLTPVVDPGARKAALARLPPEERRKYCQGFASPADLDVEARISGPVRRQRSNAQRAGNEILETVEAWYAGDPSATGHIRQTLEEGARIGAFTEILPYHPPEYPGYNPMNEPIFQVGSFMLALAHAYAILKEEYPDDTELLASVRRWGDRLFELARDGDDSFGGRSEGVDRAFMIAQGWAHWGNASGNREALAKAYRYYKFGLRAIGDGGADRIWQYIFPRRLLYYANMTYGAALSAAYALSRSGARDVYELAPGGGTVVEGAVWLWGWLLEEKPLELMNARGVGSRAVAWTELFIGEFPDHPAAARMDAWLADDIFPRYGYLNGGGPSTCLYRRIAPAS